MTSRVRVRAAGLRRGKELSPGRKRRVQEFAQHFIRWCEHRLGTAPAPFSRTLHFPKPTAADWITRPNKGRVEINTWLSDGCTFDAFLVICLHELAHVFVQGLRNKRDALQIKDSFGEHTMVMFDINADVLAAEFLRQVYGVDIGGVLGVYYDTGELFSDPRVRSWKLEKFLGTVLTLANTWGYDYPQDTGAAFPVIVPSIQAMATEGTMLLMETGGPQPRVQNVEVDPHEFAEVVQCYKRKGVSREEYITGVLSFAARILHRADFRPPRRVRGQNRHPALYSAREELQRLRRGEPDEQVEMQFDDEDYYRRGS